MNKVRSMFLYICLTLIILAGLSIMALNSISATAADEPVELDIMDGSISITNTGYTQGSGSKKSHTGSYIITQSDNENSTGNTITVNGTSGTTIYITIKNLNISAKGPIAIKESGSCILTLDGENTLEGSSGYPGIYVGSSASLTIMGNSDGKGKLEATGAISSAGIGSGSLTSDCGTIIVSGGTVIARGGSDAAGIGGGINKKAKKITINGGYVEAYGASGAAGIGGGTGKDGGTIEIIGGTVKAKSEGYGAGIGGGGGSDGGKITISGGEVEATGGKNGGAGIGGAGASSSSKDAGSGGTITISGGKIKKAQGGGGGAGIGSGECKYGTTGAVVDGGTITIKGNAEIEEAIGGTSTQTSGVGGAGIGGGYKGGGGIITISDNAKVKATGASGGAGIGGGYNNSGEKITISGYAFIDATGGGTGSGIGGAGIGGGYGSPGGTIEISENANVIANGSDGGAGIGGGKRASSAASNSGTIKISGGNVKAYGGACTNGSGAGIGGGDYGKIYVITITGGTIKASKGSEDCGRNKTPAEHIGNGANVASVGSSEDKDGDGINDGIKISNATVNDIPYGNAVYTVTYDPGNAKVVTGSHDPNEVEDGDSVKLPGAVFSRTGYTQTGWTTTNGGAEEYELGETITITEDITLYPSWEADEYNIFYMDEGDKDFSGDHADGHPLKHTYDTVTNLSTATKTGYDFVGWFTDSSCTERKKVTSLGKTDYTNNITLYAKWTAKQFTVTFDAQGGGWSGTTTQTAVQTYDSNWKFPSTDPAKEGYDFDGWYTELNGGGQKITADSVVDILNDIDLYANWKCNHEKNTNKTGTKKDETYHEIECSECHEKIAKEHTYSQWKNDGDGNHSRSCSDCGAAEKEEHNKYSKWENDGDGNHSRSCSDCGAAEKEEHNKYSKWENDGDGNHSRSCSDCGAAEKEEHNKYSKWKDDGDGNHSRSCSDCGAAEKEEHNKYSKWSNDGDGNHSRSCSDCGADEKEEHKYVDDVCTECGAKKPDGSDQTEKDPDETDPAETTTTVPGSTETDPAETTTTVPGSTETDPAETTTAVPGSTETDPAETTTEVPGSTETDPAETTTAVPGSTETDPAETTTAVPGSTETDPAETTTAVPGSTGTGTDETYPTVTEPTAAEPPAEDATQTVPSYYPSEWDPSGSAAPGIAPAGSSVPETVTVKVENKITGEIKWVKAVRIGGDVTVDLGKENNGLYANIYEKNGGFVTSVLIEKGKAKFTFLKDVRFSIVIDSEAYEDDVTADAGIYSDIDVVEDAVSVIGIMTPIAVSAVIIMKLRRKRNG